MKILLFIIALATFIITMYYADSDMGNDVGKAVVWQTICVFYLIIAKEKENKN